MTLPQVLSPHADPIGTLQYWENIHFPELSGVVSLLT